MLKAKLLFLFTILIISSEIFSQEKVSVDAYLKNAGWTEQDGGWMDPETGVIWGPETDKMSWGEAKLYCNNLRTAGKTDWRLPSIIELQYSVCSIAGYPSRTACIKPRNHQKDLWLLNKDMKKGITYWAGDLIPGDPYNSYYFVLDKEGQHVMTSKGDKSLARCVRQGVLPKATTASTEIAKSNEQKNEAEENKKEEFFFYISPLIGFGGIFTNELLVENTPYMNGELRLGFKVAEKTMVTLFVNTGLNLRDFDYPVFTSVAVGPEYFIWDSFSIFAAAGVGILTCNTTVFPTNTTTETNAGFSWKAGATWQVLKWGSKGQYALPLSVIYDGAKVRNLMSIHTATGAIGFMYFN
ncbi:MAG TPA: DUF1566 domain-containing protein [bacterium]|nr:DUF1566 domain-containing protein [bacterium]